MDLSKEQEEELHRQELEGSKLRESENIDKTKIYEYKLKKLQEKLIEIDNNSFGDNEKELINVYSEKCQLLLKKTRLFFNKDTELRQFKRAIVLLKGVDIEMRNDIIEYGREIATYMKNFSRDTLKKSKYIGWDMSENTVLWSLLFPGQPYNKIEDAITQNEYNELKRRWWEFQLEKWEIIKALYNEKFEKDFSILWNKLEESKKRIIDDVALNIDKDGRSLYKYEEVKVYLSVVVIHKELTSAIERRNFAKKYLSKIAKKRLGRANTNTLSSSWERKLNTAFGAQEKT